MEKPELFDKKYVHFIWDKELEGKKCFVADNISVLMDIVSADNTEYSSALQESFNGDYPFKTGNTCAYRFAYYDPLYEYKQAWLDGMLVQVWDNIHKDWQDVEHANVLWGETAETGKYRTEPVKLDSLEDAKLIIAKFLAYVPRSTLVLNMGESNVMQAEQFIGENPAEQFIGENPAEVIRRWREKNKERMAESHQ